MIDKEAIKARRDAATSGNWREGTCGGAVVTDFPEGRSHLGEKEYYGGYPICESALENDRVFIVHAPTDIDDLLAEVERLEGELGKFHKCHACWKAQNSGCAADYSDKEVWHKEPE